MTKKRKKPVPFHHVKAEMYVAGVMTNLPPSSRTRTMERLLTLAFIAGYDARGKDGAK